MAIYSMEDVDVDTLCSKDKGKHKCKYELSINTTQRQRNSAKHDGWMHGGVHVVRRHGMFLVVSR